jgi:hypothetical protein
VSCIVAEKVVCGANELNRDAKGISCKERMKKMKIKIEETSEVAKGALESLQTSVAVQDDPNKPA